MSQLHIFNPSHDEALAANSPYYYPARAARTLGTDLAMLPLWWANEGDSLLLPEEVEFPDDSVLPTDIHFLHPSDLKKWDDHEITSIQPWGWDPLLVHQLKKWGIPDVLLPDTDAVDKVRALSSRASAVQVLPLLRRALSRSVGESRWCVSADEALQAIGQWQKAIVKAPWSSSGRGVFVATVPLTEPVRLRIARILREQGAVEVEPYYERVFDFATEFYATRDTILYEGLSLFATTDTGAYTGNLVAEEALLLERLPREIQESLPPAIAALQTNLKQLLLPHYQGPLGVDMMCVRTADHSLALHPCIEINLRNTMGRVALALRKRVPEKQTYIYQLQPVGKGTAGGMTLTPGARIMEARLFPENL